MTSFAQPPSEMQQKSDATSHPEVVATERGSNTENAETAAKAAPEGGDDSPAPGAPAPEPGSFLLVGTGLIALALSSRRWRRTLGPSSVS